MTTLKKYNLPATPATETSIEKDTFGRFAEYRLRDTSAFTHPSKAPFGYVTRNTNGTFYASIENVEGVIPSRDNLTARQVAEYITKHLG